MTTRKLMTREPGKRGENQCDKRNYAMLFSSCWFLLVINFIVSAEYLFLTEFRIRRKTSKQTNKNQSFAELISHHMNKATTNILE